MRDRSDHHRCLYCDDVPAERLLTRRGDRGLLAPKEWPCLDIQVTMDSLDRALRIFDTILKAVSTRMAPLFWSARGRCRISDGTRTFASANSILPRSCQDEANDLRQMTRVWLAVSVDRAGPRHS
jgi:hypothetical protein